MKSTTLICLALAAALAACAAPESRSPASSVAPEVPSLTVVRPSDQALRRGETNRVTVEVRREGLPGAVALEVSNLPAGVEVIGEMPKLEDGVTTGELTLYAHPDAVLVTGHAVQVTARGPGEVAASEWFHVDVMSN